jgi:hypothetical protein
LLHTVVGTVTQIDGAVHVQTRDGEAGCVLYGPYRVLQPGSYEVVFHVLPHALDGRMCCVVDVLRRGRTIVAEKDFTADELLRRNGQIPMRFEVVETDTFEFRVHATGSAGLTVRYHRPVRLISGPPADPQDQG